MMKRTLLLGGILLPALAAGAAQAADGDYCREYQRDVTIGGKVEKAYGTACLQPDGSWQMVGDEHSSATTTVAPMVVTKVIEKPVVVEKIIVTSPRVMPPRHARKIRHDHGARMWVRPAVHAHGQVSRGGVWVGW